MKNNKIELAIEQLLFSSRWIQVPLYIGLVIASIVYAIKSSIETLHLIQHFLEWTESEVMLSILTLVDITMVVNLLVMVIIGGYTTFVSKMDLIDTHIDKPEWLKKVGSGTLKVKLAGALISISGIHLLKSFINIEKMENMATVKYQIAIHVVFLFSALLLAITDMLISKKNIYTSSKPTKNEA